MMPQKHTTPIDILTQNPTGPHHRYRMLRAGKIVLPREKSQIGYPLPSGQPDINTNNTK